MATSSTEFEVQDFSTQHSMTNTVFKENLGVRRIPNKAYIEVYYYYYYYLGWHVNN